MAQQSAAFFFPWELSSQDHYSKYLLTPWDICQCPMHMDHHSVDHPQLPLLHHMGVLAQVRRKTNQQCLAATYLVVTLPLYYCHYHHSLC